ncbi:MAG: ABC transporter ATP-binding protein [Candidatus Spyradocola sp.]|jgi:ATP-binding cassette subfamily B protein
MKTQQNGKMSRAGLIFLFLRGSKRYYLFAMLASLFVTLMEMITPQIIKLTVDSVIGSEPLSVPFFLEALVRAVGGVEVLKGNLLWIAAAVVLVAALTAVFRFLNLLETSRASETFVCRIRNLLFAHIQRLPFAWHMKNQTGDIIQRCTSDVDTVRNFVTDQFMNVVRISILLILSLTFMISMNLRLSIVAMVSIPLIFTYSMIFQRKISARFTECDESEGVLSTIAQENLTGVRVVRAFGREAYERDRFEKQNNVYTNLWMKLCKILALFWGTGDFVSLVQVMLIIVLGSLFCVQGQMTAGEFIAFISYNSMLTWPVRQLGRVIADMSKASVSIDRINYIMSSPEEHDRPGALEPDLRQDIVFDHVTFAYDDNPPVLKDVSFTIPAGSTFAILGSTSSGKSTLMYLLNRLYEVKEGCGTVSIGGVDVRNIRADYLRRGVGICLQEPFLFSRTIRENIGITTHDLDMGEIRRAASIACVDEAITEFSRGYDTVVGERGVTLSGGQKQRTAIARMLTQRAPIMVFDDSLSAVDAETDLKIRTQLKTHLGDSTVILISHRVTTLMGADCILVLDKGRVQQMGTHEELMAQDGIYRHIFNMQMSSEVTA